MTQQLLKTFIFTTIFCFLTLTQIPMLVASNQGPVKPNVNLTPQQVDKMTKELENIDKFFNSLPPEEQMEFLKQVEEAQKMINNMSDEELNQLMKEMEQFMPEVFEGLPTEAFTKPITQPDVLKPSDAPTPVSQIKQELSAKETETLTLLESIIKLSNECMVKINSSPEITQNITRWAKKGKIGNWPNIQSWQDMSNTLDSMVAKLSLLKEQDPITFFYRHLKALSEEESIKNLLKKLEKELKATVPHIDVPSLGIEKMKKEAKTSLQKAMTAFGFSLTKESLMTKIDSLLTKFGVEAAKIKQAEKGSLLKAQQQANIKPQQGRTVVSGKADHSEPSMGSFGGGYSDSPSSYESSSYFSPTANRESGYNAPSAIQTPKKDAPISNATSTKSSASATPKATVKTAKKTSYDETIDSITDSIVDIEELIDQNAKIKNITGHLTGSEPVDETIVTVLNRIQDNIEKTLTEVNRFNRRIKETGALQKKYKTKLKEQFNKNKNNLTKLKANLSGLKSKISSPEKRYAYLKEPVTFSSDKTLPSQMNKSVIELADSITRLEMEIQKE